MPTPRIRAVVFDAVGTLIEPSPPAADVYARFGAQFGSNVAAEESRRRFPAAFAGQEKLDADQRGGATSETRERERWRTIVTQVLDDVVDADALFAALWEHFARPESWRAIEGAADLLSRIQDAGLTVAVASNFDARLRGVWAGLPALPRDVELFISSEVGRRKPHLEFFAHIERRLKIPGKSILLVGDDPKNDLSGAQAAGWRAVLVAETGLAAAVRPLLPDVGWELRG